MTMTLLVYKFTLLTLPNLKLQALWRAAFATAQLPLLQDFPLTLLCTVSEGFSPADIKQVHTIVTAQVNRFALSRKGCGPHPVA